jgi:hypothetical protein
MDYIKITDYAAKDTLLTGNPAKLVKGSEIGADFDAVAVAVATKADLVSPSFTTPDLGVATATSVNKLTITAPATSATFTIANGKTLTASNTLTLAGTDSTTMTFPASSGTVLTAALQNAITNPSNLSVNFGTGALTAGTGTFSGELSITGDVAAHLKQEYALKWTSNGASNGTLRSYIYGSTSGNLILTASSGGVATLNSTGLAVTGTQTITKAVVGDVLTAGVSAGKSAYMSIDSAGFGLFSGAGQTGSGIYVSDASSFIYFATAGTEHLRIDSSGNLVLNGGAASGNKRVQVKQATLANNEFAYFAASGGTAGTINRSFEGGVTKHSGIANACGYVIMYTQDGVGNHLWFDDSDQLRTSTTTTHIGTTSGTVVGTQTSDERLKNIAPSFDYGLSQINALVPISFAFKDAPDVQKVGFSAQQVRPIIPEAVYDTNECLDGYTKDESGEDKPNSDRTKLAMEYTQIVPVLVKAIQELTARLAALEAK